MAYYGDLRSGDTLYILFTSRRFTTGVPFTLAGSPTAAVYKDDGTTMSTAGLTLTASFDSVAGQNMLKIDTSSDGTFYAEGHDFSVVLTAGTVDSVSVVGEVLGTFSLAQRSALRPTTKGRTLDVASTGEAGLDFDNIKDATGSHTLTNIVIADPAGVTTLLARVGAFTGTGLNTVLGFFRALMRKDASILPSDVGGTFDETTDSLEALEEQQPFIIV